MDTEQRITSYGLIGKWFRSLPEHEKDAAVASLMALLEVHGVDADVVLQTVKRSIVMWRKMNGVV